MADNERFLIHSQAEIARVLRRLMNARSVVTGLFDGGKSHLLTSVVLVDPQRNLLALDYGPDALINQRVVHAPKVFMVAKLDHVEVKFTLNSLGEARLEGESVFRCQLPESIYYPQQREFFRLPLPKLAPLKCRMTLEDGTPAVLNVVDISVGGVGVIDYAGALQLVKAGVYPRSRMELPGYGEIIFDLEVRAVFEVKLKQGEVSRRAGCAFLNLSQEHALWVQRFINQQQVELRR